MHHVIAVNNGGARRIPKLFFLLIFALAQDRAAFAGGIFDKALSQPLSLGSVQADKRAALKLAVNRSQPRSQEANLLDGYEQQVMIGLLAANFLYLMVFIQLLNILAF